MDKIFFVIVGLIFATSLITATMYLTKHGRRSIIESKQREIDNLRSVNPIAVFIVAPVYILFYIFMIAYCLKEITG